MSLVPNASMRTSLEAATQEYHKQLLDSDPHLTYLEKERGLERDQIVSFRLGAVVDPLSGHEDYLNRIVFPYLTKSGVTTLRFRRFPDEGSKNKFLSLSGDEARIYNVTALLGRPDKIYICEGETDTIAATQAGLRAIGLPGVTTWSPVFARVLRDWDVVVLADNDDAGEGMKMARAIYKSLGGCDILALPEGYDVCKYVNEQGASALRERLGYGREGA